MRRNEITPELIEFSKRAKKLGFPQDVESIKEGDWLCDSVSQEILLVTEIQHHVFISAPPTISIEAVNIDDDNNSVIYDDPYDYTLILEFSRCLEWLLLHNYCVQMEAPLTPVGEYFVYYQQDRYGESDIDDCESAKTHHEAIAKAVVKILEGKK